MISTQSQSDPGPSKYPIIVTSHSTRLGKAIGFAPRPIRDAVIEAGGMVELMAKVAWSAISRPTGYWGAVLEDMAFTIRKSWLPVTITLSAFLTAFTFLSIIFLDMVGATGLFGPLVLMFSSRNFTVLFLGVVIIGVIGAALTADIGSRKVREELDAMQVMGIDPIRDLAVPRIISVTFLSALLSLPALLVTVVSMQIAAFYIAGLPAADFYSNLFDNFYPHDVVSVIINCLILGLIVGVVCSYKGFTASGGAVGLGRAVNQAVVIALAGMFVMQLAYQALFQGLFPELGEFR